MANKCTHPSSTWQSWFYLSGVTSGIMMRLKTCDTCGATVDTQTKEA